MNDVDDGLPEDVLALLRAERPLDPLPPGADEALAAKLSLSLGISVVAAGAAGSLVSSSSAASSSAASSSAASSSAAVTSSTAVAGAAKVGLGALIGKPIVIAALVVGAGSGVLSTLVVQRVTAPAVDSVVVVTPAAPAARIDVVAPPAKPLPASSSPPTPLVPAPPAPPASSPPVVVAPPAAGDTWQLQEPAARAGVDAQDPAAERRLVETARAALQQGDVAAAQTALREHRRRFPRGAFVEEQAALSVIAAAQAGDPKVSDHARAFRARFPSSLFLPAVDAALAR